MMTNPRTLLLCTVVWALALGGPVVRAEIIPMNAWIHDPVISSVGVSPDGNQLVALTLSDINAPPQVTVWQTEDLSVAPVRFSPLDVKARAVGWLNDEYLFVIGRQKFDIRVGGRAIRSFREKLYIIDDQGEERWRELLENEDGFKNIFDVLPHDPGRFLASRTDFESATDIYEVNLRNFNSRRIFRGASGENIVADAFGEIRGRIELEGTGDSTRLEYSYIHPETGQWDVHHELVAVDREGMTPRGFDLDGRRVYMVDNTGRDKAVLRTYDLITRELSEPLFGGLDMEAMGVRFASNPDNLGEVIGYVGANEKVWINYTSPTYQEISDRLDEVLGKEDVHTIVSMSDDLTVMVVHTSGDREPGAYHLLVNGRQLVPLGRSYPFLEPAKLSDMEYVTYEARDGLEIPAYLTLPAEGESPYPAVVMPHGGPWVRDYHGWDLWAQFLANRGYAVLQPQYRGSEGWGQELWRAGDREWGQKMQDDKDDGAGWMVEQGIAAADRIAMFGYSYGGFAAMAASVRRNSPYQCAISGAGLSELRTFDRVTFEGRFNRLFQNPTVAGMSPLDHVEDAEIPIFVFHGDRDQRVPIDQSEKFVSALQRAGKDVKYMEIVDLWHSYPWWPQHHLAMLSEIESYLSTQCGPGRVVSVCVRHGRQTPIMRARGIGRSITPSWNCW